MNENSQSNRINGKDLINVGVFTAIIAVIMMIIMPIGFIPVLMPLYCVLIPLICGIPWMLFITKVDKFGMILIMSTLLGLILMLTGMGWYPIPIAMISGLVAEFIVRKGNYKNLKLDVLAYGFFSIWCFGSFVPLIFLADQYWTDSANYGEEFISSAKNIFQLWTAPVLVLCCFVFGLLGGWIGVKIMKKHFVKAELV